MKESQLSTASQNLKYAASQFWICILRSAHSKGGHVIKLGEVLSEFNGTQRTLKMH